MGAGGASFVPYCQTVVDFNTAGSHLVVGPAAGEFTISRAGYYRVTYWGVSDGGSGVASVRFQKNGLDIHSGFQSGTALSELHADLVWPFAAGDRLGVAIRAGMPIAFQPHPSRRLQITYEGPL